MADVYGLDMPDLPEGAAVIDCVTIVKWLDANGHVTITEMFSEGITRWEAIGMATTFMDGLRRSLMSDPRDGSDDDDAND